MRWYALIIFCVAGAQSWSQDAVKAVKADEDMNQVFTVNDLYRYPQFVQGSVIFRDGTTAGARLNYHKYYGQMLFIDDKGDSLALGNPETIRVIVIDKDSFFYNKESFLELIGSYESILLARKQSLREMDQKKTGAYGQSYTNNSVASNKNYYTVDGRPRLNVGESTLFSQTNEYFISYRQDNFIPATKKNIDKLFSRYVVDIREYMKSHAIDFGKAEDLKQLMAFIASLQKK